MPEAKYLVSGGSIEKPTTIPKVKRVAGGDVLRLRKETGGDPEPADVERTLDQHDPLLLRGKPERHRAAWRGWGTDGTAWTS